MSMKQLVTKLKNLPNCTVYAPSGLPDKKPQHMLPADLKDFYELCSGAVLFEESDYPIRLLKSDEFALANPIIIGEQIERDITADWYIVAQGGSEEYVSIDLNQSRLGKCYDSFWDRHGVAGDCAIIAQSFTELLERLMQQKGQEHYWLRDDFVSYGDAYDGVK
ncbi:SMI1/KNR4 family protein [Desmospora profundinema]|uniref:Knr4/Smi1-like domain-containing protein n=1 Tax=Desmospora profundinema TaxID=1571184 RepID=A0ABU1IQK7_9BACL|nr:SMI1/KNR4 family protein [Desmospora profundinema]MDR6226822.1 hypothetical protein [Desmospora profundinema]